LNAEVVFTLYPGHATEIVQNSDSQGVAVFGGDGTIAEVVNGMDLDRQCLLLLAGGTGNGLARDLGLISIDTSFDSVRKNRQQRLDLIRVIFQTQDQIQSRLAISTASIGYAAEVVVLANRYFKRLGGWCYPLAASLQAARQSAFWLNVSINNEIVTKRHLSNVMVNNTRHAGNFGAFRQSDPCDGQFEILLAKAGFFGQFLHNLAVLSRTYFYRTAEECMAHNLNLDMSVPQRLMIDGEMWENVLEASFEILPGRLCCFV